MASELRLESNKILRLWLRDMTGRVANFGAGSDRDKQGWSYRNYCLQAEYCTLDVRGNVRIHADITNMPEIRDGIFDGGLCIWVLEHLKEPLLAMREMRRVLRPGAVLVVGAPLIYPYHGTDYWRFSAEGLRRLSEGWNLNELAPVGAERKVELDSRLKFFGHVDAKRGPLGWLALLQRRGVGA